MSYKSYDLRLGIKDTGFNERALENSRGQFDRNIKNSPNYEEVLLNGVDKIDSIITEYSYTLSNLDKKKLSTSYDSAVVVGDYVSFNDSNWIVLTTHNYSIRAYKENIIERCNLNPFMYKIGEVTYSDYGVYYAKSYVNQFGEAINLPNDNMDLKIPLNINTKKISLNDIFYVFEDNWYQCYRVASIGRSYYDGDNGILDIRAEIVDSAITPQQYYGLEPTSDIIKNVVITPNTLSLTKSSSGNLTAMVYGLDGHIIPGALVEWSSNDPTVAIVVNGVVSAIKVGNCDIIATSKDDEAMFATCKVSVVEGGGWF